VILVSHDRFLVESCADRLWLIGGGQVKPFDGDMDDYRKLVLSGDLSPERAEKRADKREAEKGGDRKVAADKRAQLAPLRKKLTAAEARIEKFTGIIARIDEAIGDGSAFQRDPVKAAELSRMRGEAADAVARAEEEWLEISEQLES
jgi:ATP-binding cassette, subfamily F, member 3